MPLDEKCYHLNRAMITLTVNGKPKELAKPVTLDQFLHDNNIDFQFVAVAHNGNILRREEFSTVLLANEDVVEIVRPVGGG